MKQRQLGSTARVGNDEAARIEARAHRRAIRPWLLGGGASINGEVGWLSRSAAGMTGTGRVADGRRGGGGGIWIREREEEGGGSA